MSILRQSYRDLAPIVAEDQNVASSGSGFYSSWDEQDLALAQTIRAVRAIRGTARPRAEMPGVGVQEEIRAALGHLCSAMDGLVGWMQQRGQVHSEALQLVVRLRQAGDAVAQCMAECPVDVVLQEPELSG